MESIIPSIRHHSGGSRCRQKAESPLFPGCGATWLAFWLERPRAPQDCPHGRTRMLNHAREILCPRCCLASSFPSWPRHAARGCYPTLMHRRSAARKPLPEMANSAHFMLGNATVSRSRYCRSVSNTTQLSTRDTSGEMASSTHWSCLRTSQTLPDPSSLKTSTISRKQQQSLNYRDIYFEDTLCSIVYSERANCIIAISLQWTITMVTRYIWTNYRTRNTRR